MSTVTSPVDNGVNVEALLGAREAGRGYSVPRHVHGRARVPLRGGGPRWNGLKRLNGN